MACLIKPATEGSKGVITLTTPERDRLVHGFTDVRQQLVSLKPRYAIGLHHNWHDYALHYDDLFDFHMAGQDDLKEVNGRYVPLVPMDACNFSPACFQPGTSEKFWDVLFVARAVAFKGIPEFFLAIRKMFDAGHRLRVLFICPVPPQEGVGSMRDVRSYYDAMFTSQEQELFTLLTTDFRYPFPFDLPTLAHFYRSSRVFVHSAPDERRCRVAAYAWAAGLPVVGMAPVGSVLSPALRKTPYFYEISSYEEFPEQIGRAIAATRTPRDFSDVQAEIAEAQSVHLLEQHLSRLFKEAGWAPPEAGGWLHGLDIRLGRHHGLPAGVNRLDQDLGAFLQFLIDGPPEDLASLTVCLDPEAEIARLKPLVPRLISEAKPPRKTLRQTVGPLVRSVLGRQA